MADWKMILGVGAGAAVLYAMTRTTRRGDPCKRYTENLAKHGNLVAQGRYAEAQAVLPQMVGSQVECAKVGGLDGASAPSHTGVRGGTKAGGSPGGPSAKQGGKIPGSTGKKVGGDDGVSSGKPALPKGFSWSFAEHFTIHGTTYDIFTGGDKKGWVWGIIGPSGQPATGLTSGDNRFSNPWNAVKNAKGAIEAVHKWGF